LLSLVNLLILYLFALFPDYLHSWYFIRIFVSLTSTLKTWVSLKSTLPPLYYQLQYLSMSLTFLKYTVVSISLKFYRQVSVNKNCSTICCGRFKLYWGQKLNLSFHARMNHNRSNLDSYSYSFVFVRLIITWEYVHHAPYCCLNWSC
jgi:hypothetical protein